MAQKVQVQLIDDITGDEAAETINFGLDGTNYEIDLTSDNAKEMRDLLSIYTEKARKVRAGDRAGRQRPSTTNRAETQRVRQWATGAGYTVSSRGRISAEIIEAYRAANA